MRDMITRIAPRRGVTMLFETLVLFALMAGVVVFFLKGTRIAESVEGFAVVQADAQGRIAMKMRKDDKVLAVLRRAAIGEQAQIELAPRISEPPQKLSGKLENISFGENTATVRFIAASPSKQWSGDAYVRLKLRTENLLEVAFQRVGRAVFPAAIGSR